MKKSFIATGPGLPIAADKRDIRAQLLKTNDVVN